MEKLLDPKRRDVEAAVLMRVSNLICIIYYFPRDPKFYDVVVVANR